MEMGCTTTNRHYSWNTVKLAAFASSMVIPFHLDICAYVPHGSLLV